MVVREQSQGAPGSRESGRRRKRQEIGAVPNKPPTWDERIIGSSPAIRKVINQVKRIAPLSCGVLITGPTGCGKELVARGVHEASGREGEFVVIDCSALPPDILEAELFGTSKGAYTGATTRSGLFEAANGGTIFLDEIGELALELQAKLLRAIQEKRIRRVGEAGYIDLDVRIVAATHRNLKQMVSEHRFREDLFHRLNRYPVRVPALSERGRDVIAIAKHFLATDPDLVQLASQSWPQPAPVPPAPKTAPQVPAASVQHAEGSVTNRSTAASFGESQKGANNPGQAGGSLQLSRDAVAVLCDHLWPGNIRELQDVLFRAAIDCRAKRLQARHIIEALDGQCVGEQQPREGTSGRILALIDGAGKVKTSALRRELKLSNGDQHRTITRLLQEGTIMREGRGANVRYLRLSTESALEAASSPLLALEPGESAVLDLITTCGEVGRQDLVQRFSMSERTASRLLGRMEKKGHLEKCGAGRAQRYRLPIVAKTGNSDHTSHAG